MPRIEFKDKTVLAVLMQWDYGKPERGVSCEKRWFFDNLVRLAGRVEPFWFDAHLDDTPRLNRELLARARELKPDLIFFVPYTDQFKTATLDALKAEFTTYAWFADDQWRFEGYTRRYAAHFTWCSTTYRYCLPRYREIGANPILTQWAGQAYSDELGPLPAGQPCRHEVSFVGQINPYRKWFVGMLAKRGIRVECFGGGWQNGRISFEEMERVFRTSRINLNISNTINHDIRYVLGGARNFLDYWRSPKRAEQVKGRHFEIPLSGGFQLASYAISLEDHFDIGRDIAVYGTLDECVIQIRHFLADEPHRLAITERSHERALREHTYEARVKNLLVEIFGRNLGTQVQISKQEPAN